MLMGPAINAELDFRLSERWFGVRTFFVAGFIHDSACRSLVGHGRCVV